MKPLPWRSAAASLLLAGAFAASAGQAPLAASDPRGTVAQEPAYSLAGYALKLIATGDKCAIEYQNGTNAPTRLSLDMAPPCYLPVWRQPLPQPRRKSHATDVLPVGEIGAPIAWRHPRGRTLFAVLGDPMPPDQVSSKLYQTRLAQNMHCTSSMQGVWVLKNRLELAALRKDIGVVCVELGLEEKDFWLLAHPKP